MGCMHVSESQLQSSPGSASFDCLHNLEPQQGLAMAFLIGQYASDTIPLLIFDQSPV